MSDAPVRIAVVGAGSIGRRHVGYVGRNKNCRLHAIVDPSESAREFAESLDIRWHSSLDSLFGGERPDGVIISTPNNLHYEHALRCVAERIPMLVEKPLADTLERGVRICEAAEAANVPVLVGHHRRHSEIIARAAEVIAAGTLGRIVAFTGFALFYKGDAEGYFDGANAWRRKPGGGPILINMIHEIDNMRALCGEIAQVQAFSSSATRNYPVEDTSAISIRFNNGALGTFVLSDTAASDRSWELTSGEDSRYGAAHSDKDDCYVVAGTMGSLSIPTMRLLKYGSPESRSWRKPFDRGVVPLAAADPLERQIAHFRDVILGLAPPRVSGRDGLQNLHVVAAIVEAATTGKAVAI